MKSPNSLRPYGATYAREFKAAGYTRPKSITIDCHGHMAVPESDELVRPHLPASELDAVKYASPESRAVNIKQGKERFSEMSGVHERLEEMDRMGVDVMVISPPPPHFNYQADPGLCQESCQLINDKLAASAMSSNGRLVALGTVPLQDTKRAIAELERCVNTLGLPGIEIGANAGSDEVSAERLESFWARVEELNACVLLHPTSFASDRLSAHYLTNIVGNPLETTVAVHHLIFDGVLERYPALKILLAHGGAYAAAYAARMDHAWGARPDCKGSISRPPTEYLHQFYFDSVVFGTDQLATLSAKFGADRVLMGTDYPFDMGEYNPVEHIQVTAELTDDDRANICGLNAVKFFGIESKCAGVANFNNGLVSK
ncbi:MAG: amidohydrolase [Granulosicoccus sp.]|nr:amidohydrolase [Granulosicoccus sp.]